MLIYKLIKGLILINYIIKELIIKTLKKDLLI
jgi:hypothetical protein